MKLNFQWHVVTELQPIACFANGHRGHALHKPVASEGVVNALAAIVETNREEKTQLFDHGYYGDAAVITRHF
mgnify:CR=1 FL=1